MEKKFTVKFTGASAKEYSFDFYNLGGNWNEIAGVYLMARYDEEKNKVYPIYIGETDNLKNRLFNHHKQSCFDKNNANVLGWIGETIEKNRLAIEEDLKNGLKPPCND